MVQRVNLHPKPRPRFIEPMECTRVATLPEGEDWVYEIKQDGYRAIGLIDGNSAMLYSMSGQDYSSEFRHIVFALQSLHQGNLVLDGEIRWTSEGVPASKNCKIGAPPGGRRLLLVRRAPSKRT